MNHTKRIKDYRVLMKMTQQNVADQFGISKQAYSQKERGVIKFTHDQMIGFKMLVNRVDPTATIDDIFFSD